MSYKINLGIYLLNTSNHQIISNEKVYFFMINRESGLVCWVFITFGCLPEEQRLTSVPAK